MESNQEQNVATYCRAVVAVVLSLILAGYFLIAAGNGTAAGNKEGIWKPFLVEEDLSKIIDDEVNIIKKELDKPKPDEKKIRASALVVFLAAQDCKDRGEGRQLAMLRASSHLLVLDAGKMESALAKRVVDDIANYKKRKSSPNPDLGPVNIKELVEELGDAMLVFDKTEKGGEGIERDLLILSTQKKPFTPAQMSDMVLVMANKTALIAEVAKAFDDLAKNQKKDWLTWTDDMRQGALDLASAVKAKNNKGMKTAINKMNSACFACHAKFRDK